MKPSYAPFRTSSRARLQSFFSRSSTRGRTSLSMNCRAVSAIIRCSSVKSSGVKTSSGVLSSIRKLPPTTIFLSSATADISLILSSVLSGNGVRLCPAFVCEGKINKDGQDGQDEKPEDENRI